MDGAGTLTVFTRIILPMCTPILATVGIFSAVNQWELFPGHPDLHDRF